MGDVADVQVTTQFRGRVLLPVGSVFADERTGRNATLAELSACSWDPSDPTLRRVVFLSDSGVLWHIDVHIEDGRLVQVIPGRWTRLSRPGGATIDSEGLDFASDTSDDGAMLIVSSEAHARAGGGSSVLDVATYALADGRYLASPFEVPALVRNGVVDNGGFEGLGHTADRSLFATANEVRACAHSAAGLDRMPSRPHRPHSTPRRGARAGCPLGRRPAPPASSPLQRNSWAQRARARAGRHAALRSGQCEERARGAG